MLASSNYRTGVHINFAQSRILAAKVCNLQSEYGCDQASSQVERGAMSRGGAEAPLNFFRYVF